MKLKISIRVGWNRRMWWDTQKKWVALSCLLYLWWPEFCGIVLKTPMTVLLLHTQFNELSSFLFLNFQNHRPKHCRAVGGSKHQKNNTILKKIKQRAIVRLDVLGSRNQFPIYFVSCSRGKMVESPPPLLRDLYFDFAWNSKLWNRKERKLKKHFFGEWSFLHS